MICVSLSEKNSLSIDIKKYDFVELRLDCLDLNKSEIKKYFSTSCSIATFRPNNKVTESHRIEQLSEAIIAGANYVDIEYDNPLTDIITLAKKHSCKIILSYHNFELTPSNQVLREIIYSYDFPEIIKIACNTKTKEDVARILSLYQLKMSNKLICIGMGEIGRISRITSVKLGAPFTFTYPDGGRSTAKGQYSFTRLNNLFKQL